MVVLKLHDDYTREEVHRIFSPASPFTPQRGTWGLHGFVPLPDRAGDYVFFVTFGQVQAEHEFDEGISRAGVVRWQSQPSQTLDDADVRRWIAHDESRNSVYLFLRTRSRRNGAPAPYTYLGRLKYLSHDAERERPVHFRWELLDWPIPLDALQRMGLSLEKGGDEPAEPAPSPGPLGDLVETEPPAQATPQVGASQTTSAFKAARSAKASQRDKTLGLAGELRVVEHEKARLAAAGRPDLAAAVVHVAAVEGDGAGYDIRSYEDDGAPRYVEVKTTTGARSADFYVTANELRFSEEHPNNYHLVRLYAFDPKSGAGEFFRVTGALSARFNLTPTEYRVSRLVDDG